MALLNPPARRLGQDNALLSGYSAHRGYFVPGFAGPLSIKTVLRGEAVWATNDASFRVDAGHLLILNDGQRYSLTIERDGPAETLCAFFRQGFVEDALRSYVEAPSRLLDDPEPLQPTFVLLALLTGSASEGGEKMRISNVILRVADVPRSVEFYRDRIGMTVRFASEEFAALDGGGVTLLLSKPEAPPKGEAGGLTALTEVVLEVPDVLASFKTLKDRGVSFRVDPRVVTSDGQRDLLAADFRDPDGHVLSLTGWVPHPPR